MKRASLTILMSLAATLAGCAGPRAQSNSLDTDMEPVIAERSQPTNSNGGFVYGGGSLYSPRKARQIGDLVTIRVVQSTAADTTAGTNLKRKSDMSASVSALFGLETVIADIPGGGPSLSLGATTKNDFDGTGGTNRAGSLSGTLTARVVELLPNGHLVVLGKQAVKINNEVEVLAIRGVVDPRSIAADNSVFSTAIADARIEYGGTGVVAGKQRPGWFSRVLDMVSPF